MFILLLCLFKYKQGSRKENNYANYLYLFFLFKINIKKNNNNAC